MMDWALVGNLGFPIGLSIFLLTKLEKRLGSIETSMTGKDGVLDKLDDIRDAVKNNMEAVKRNHRK
jgi:hypothetical protein